MFSEICEHGGKLVAIDLGIFKRVDSRTGVIAREIWLPEYKVGLTNKLLSLAGEVDKSIEAFKTKAKAEGLNKLGVLYSGGVDSEATLSILLKKEPNNINIYFFRLTYNDQELNSHDFAYAEKFCRARDLKLNIVDFKVDQYWSSDEYWEFVESTKCCSPQMPIIFEMAKRVLVEFGDFPIISLTQPEIIKINENLFYEQKDKDLTIAKYITNNNLPIADTFFSQFTSSIYAFLTHPFMIQSITERPITCTSEIKHLVYENLFGIEIEPRPKFHGFELNMELDTLARIEIKKRFNFVDQSVYFDLEYFLSHLRGEVEFSANDIQPIFKGKMFYIIKDSLKCF